MAVEKGTGSGGTPEETTVEETEVNVIDFPVSGVTELEDGSVIVGDVPVEEEPLDTSFEANLAEAIDDSDLMTISNELSNEIQEDISSRQDWEDSYKRGIDLLGMTYEERTQPFEGASGVVHPLLAESVTQFQAQAYREMLPSGGPVRTQIIGQENPEVVAQAERIKSYMNYMITYEM